MALISLTPLQQADEIRRSYDGLRALWSEGVAPLRHDVGHLGGSAPHDLYWRPELRVWAFFDELPDEGRGRYWCAFGTSDPVVTGDCLNITCEINPPFSGINRQCAGLFATDALGYVHLVHTGRIGGGRPGIGKATFTAWYEQGARAQVIWPGQTAEAFDLGRIESGTVVAGNIARFAHAVDDFKSRRPV